MSDAVLEFIPEFNSKVWALFTKVRLRSSVSQSVRVGMVVDLRNHDSNKRLMYKVLFQRPEDQAMFGWTYLYADDLEVVQ